MPPLNTLFALLLARPTGELAPQLAHELDALLASQRVRSALDELQTHRVLPLLAHQLSAFGRLDTLAASERSRLLAAQQKVRQLNGLLFLCASGLLRCAQELGTTPLVLKGLLLADSYYPDPSTRPMGDLDVVSAPGEADLLIRALTQSGFAKVRDHVAQHHAVAFENEHGVSCDAHSYIESYPHADWQTITRETTLSRLRGLKVRTLEPNMMLAHLMDHLHGHGREGGLVLLWVLDIAFVLRRHSAEIDARILRRSIEKPAVWALLLRVLGLLARHGAELPASLSSLRASIQRAPRLSLASVMRGRRTIPWGLPAPLGYLRVLAQRLSLRDYSQHNSRTPPSVSDLCWLPLDMLATHLAERAHYRE